MIPSTLHYMLVRLAADLLARALGCTPDVENCRLLAVGTEPGAEFARNRTEDRNDRSRRWNSRRCNRGHSRKQRAGRGVSNKTIPILGSKTAPTHYGQRYSHILQPLLSALTSPDVPLKLKPIQNTSRLFDEIVIFARDCLT